MAKKVKTDNASKQSAKQSTVYIGKPLKGLPRFTIFKDGVLPPHIAEMAAKDETIIGLIVPANELQEARKNVHVKGHILNFYLTKQK